MNKMITEKIARVLIFTIGGLLCIGSIDVAFKILGVLLMVNSIGNEINTKKDEN